MFCRNCGAKINESDSVFCEECGARLDIPVPAENRPQPSAFAGDRNGSDARFPSADGVIFPASAPDPRSDHIPAAKNGAVLEGTIRVSPPAGSDTPVAYPATPRYESADLPLPGGYRSDPASSGNSAADKKKRTLVIVLIISVIVLCAVVAAGVILFGDKLFGGKKNDTEAAEQVSDTADSAESPSDASSDGDEAAEPVSGTAGEVDAEPSAEVTTAPQTQTTAEVTTEAPAETTPEVTTAPPVETTHEITTEAPIETETEFVFPSGGDYWMDDGRVRFFVPDGFEILDYDLTSKGSRYSLFNADCNMTITVNAVDYPQGSAKDILAEDYEGYDKRGKTVTYSYIDDHLFTISGYIDVSNYIFYDREQIFDASPDCLVSICFDYPFENSEKCNSILEDFLTDFSVTG